MAVDTRCRGSNRPPATRVGATASVLCARRECFPDTSALAWTRRRCACAGHMGKLRSQDLQGRRHTSPSAPSFRCGSAATGCSDLQRMRGGTRRPAPALVRLEELVHPSAPLNCLRGSTPRGWSLALTRISEQSGGWQSATIPCSSDNEVCTRSTHAYNKNTARCRPPWSGYRRRHGAIDSNGPRWRVFLQVWSR